MKRTIVDMFEESVRLYKNNTFLLEKKTNKYEALTYGETYEEVLTLGAGLFDLGVKKGDRMALLSEGRNAWIMGELAMFYAGATNVPLSIKLEENNDLFFRLHHADVRYILVSAHQLKKIRSIIDQLPLIQKVIVLDEVYDLQENEITYNQWKEAGLNWRKTHSEDELLEVGHSLENDDRATITYTSGTTADPKGVILTHRNYTANIEQSLTSMDIDASWRTLIILPLDHCFAHVVGFYIFMSKGAQVATVQVGKTSRETLRNIPINIKEVKPSLILSVPALAKTFRKNIEAGIKKKGKRIEKLFQLGLRLKYWYNGDSDEQIGSDLKIFAKPIVFLFDLFLFSKIKANFGGKLRFFVGGGALLDAELQRFYYAIGLPMYQGYGLSEATPVISTNGPRRHSFGSSGVLVKPLEMTIRDGESKILPVGEKGEIVIKGENVMAGYWKNPEATAETVRKGWLYTGDMGYMGKDGLLYVLGRFKSLLIGADGEKYSPEGIEEALVELSPAIDQVLLYNNQSPYTTAMVVPNLAFLKSYVEEKGLNWGEQAVIEEAIKEINREINQFKKGGVLEERFPERWLPTTFIVLPEPFTEQNGLVNSTMKVMRNKVETHYAEELKYLYTPEGKNILNDRNRQALED